MVGFFSVRACSIPGSFEDERNQVPDIQLSFTDLLEVVVENMKNSSVSPLVTGGKNVYEPTVEMIIWHDP